MTDPEELRTRAASIFERLRQGGSRMAPVMGTEPDARKAGIEGHGADETPTGDAGDAGGTERAGDVGPAGDAGPGADSTSGGGTGDAGDAGPEREEPSAQVQGAASETAPVGDEARDAPAGSEGPPGTDGHAGDEFTHTDRPTDRPTTVSAGQSPVGPEAHPAADGDDDAGPRPTSIVTANQGGDSTTERAIDAPEHPEIAAPQAASETPAPPPGGFRTTAASADDSPTTSPAPNTAGPAATASTAGPAATAGGAEPAGLDGSGATALPVDLAGAGAPAEASRPADWRGQRPLPRIFAIANQKGGVGKTTTAVNLGAALAELGYRVLVIDLDPQGNATTGLGINARNLDTSIYDVLLHDVGIEDCIEPTSLRNLFVVPATIDLAGAEIELVPVFSRELRLRRAIERIKDDFDFTLIDCPPSLGLLTVNGLAAATEVVVPIQCEYYALEGLGQLLRNVNLVSANLNPSLEVTTIILTMYDARTRLAEQVVADVRSHFGDRVCRSVVPRTVRLSEAPSFGQPIIVFDSSSRGAIAYRELAKEVSGGAPQRVG